MTDKTATSRNKRRPNWRADWLVLTCRPPYGYAPGGEAYNRTLVPTDLGRKIVPLIFAKVIAGESRRAIVRWLDIEGVSAPNGGNWYPELVSRLIKNTTYVGQRQRQDASGTILTCEPVIDADTFRLANEALTNRSHQTRFQRAQQGPEGE